MISLVMKIYSFEVWTMEEPKPAHIGILRGEETDPYVIDSEK